MLSLVSARSAFPRSALPFSLSPRASAFSEKSEVQLDECIPHSDLIPLVCQSVRGHALQSIFTSRCCRCDSALLDRLLPSAQRNRLQEDDEFLHVVYKVREILLRDGHFSTRTFTVIVDEPAAAVGAGEPDLGVSWNEPVRCLVGFCGAGGSPGRAVTVDGDGGASLCDARLRAR